MKSSNFVLPVLLAIAMLGTVQAEIELKSVGPIAFGEKGILFVSDPLAATIHAIETGDNSKADNHKGLTIENIDKRIADMLGVNQDGIIIQDLAVNPASGNAYLSVSRGRGADSVAVLLIVNAADGKISELDLSKAKATSLKIPNPAPDRRDRRGRSLRTQAITDLSFIDGEVYVAGLSNEEFASNLRAIPYPFKEANPGSSIEIYHGAHGAFETRSPIRTFAAYDIAGETNLLAAYTCTPLVRIPVKSLKPQSKVKGTTVAELGNRNRPLDMVVYKKDGNDYILMANSARGVMKIKLDDVADQVGITQRVSRGGVAGLPYETIKELQGVVQLDRLNESSALILVRDSEGNHHLKIIEMP